MTSKTATNESKLATQPQLSPKRTKLLDEATKYMELKKSLGKNWMKDTDRVNEIFY